MANGRRSDLRSMQSCPILSCRYRPHNQAALLVWATRAHLVRTQNTGKTVRAQKNNNHRMCCVTHVWYRAREHGRFHTRAHVPHLDLHSVLEFPRTPAHTKDHQTHTRTQRHVRAHWVHIRTHRTQPVKSMLARVPLYAHVHPRIP